MNKIHASARDIAAVVEEFDDYLGTVIPETSKMQSYAVSYICQMLSDEYEAKICDLGGVFSAENHCDNDETIYVDLLGLRRVFANIIGNSIRHAGAKRLEVKVTVRKSKESIIFRLSDNGCGVSEEEFAHLFEPFYTSDKSRKLSGLGLAICKQIAEAMGGHISAENGHGFCIVVSMKAGVPV